MTLPTASVPDRSTIEAMNETDRRESFCQRRDVLFPCQPPKLLEALSSSRLVAFTGIGGGPQANVQRSPYGPENWSA